MAGFNVSYVARDMDSDLHLFCRYEPDKEDGLWMAGDDDAPDAIKLPNYMFWEVKPGECMKLVAMPITDTYADEHGNGD